MQGMHMLMRMRMRMRTHMHMHTHTHVCVILCMLCMLHMLYMLHPPLRYCHLTDWYEGSTTGHGFFGPDAPALLGFDADIHNFCGGSNCDGRGVNILMLFGHIKYNTCRNFEWQMCAVRGLLNSQDKKEIMFARAPNTMYIDGYPPLGRCSGWTDAPCDAYTGYANDDIYYIEVCDVHVHVHVHMRPICMRMRMCMCTEYANDDIFYIEVCLSRTALATHIVTCTSSVGRISSTSRNSHDIYMISLWAEMGSLTLACPGLPLQHGV